MDGNMAGEEPLFAVKETGWEVVEREMVVRDVLG